MVTHTCNSSGKGGEAGGPQIGGQLGLLSKTLNGSVEGQSCDLERDEIGLQ